MVEIAERVVVDVGHVGAVVVERAEFPRIVRRGVVRGEVHHDLDAVGVAGIDHRVEFGPGIGRIAEMFLDAFEIARPVAVIADAGRGRNVTVVEGWRNPDTGHAHALQIRNLGLNPGEIPSLVFREISVGCIVQTAALRRIVVGCRAVEKAVGENLIDNFVLEIVGKGGHGRDHQPEGEQDNAPLLVR